MKRPEEALCRTIAQYLSRTLPATAWFTHVPNEGSSSRVRGAILKAMGVRAGTPDYLIVYGGRAYWIEVKVKGSYLSDSQKMCHRGLACAGFEPVTARSLEEVETALIGWGVPLKARLAA